MASKENTDKTQIHSPITSTKRDLVSDPPEISTSKKQRADSSMSPPTNKETMCSEGDQDTDDTPKDISTAASETPPQGSIIKDSNLDHSVTIDGAHQQETFSVVGETDSEHNSDMDVDIMSNEDATNTPETNNTNEPIKPLDPTTGTNNETTKPIDPTPETIKEAQTGTTTPKTSESISSPPSTPLTTDKIPSTTTTSSSQGTTPSTEKKDEFRTTSIDRSSAVRLPFSDKFFFTDEAYEAYSYDSFTATVDRMIKKNKPGLALSLDPPKSSETSSIQLSTSSSQIDTTKLRSEDNKSNNNRDEDISGGHEDKASASSVGGSMLDSLLDSISKNDRPVKQPPPMRPLSDIEIAMQAADPPQE